MFIACALLILGFVVFISVRDWVYSPRLSANSVQKSLKLILQYISLQEWEKAQKELSPLLSHGKGGKESALFEIQVLRGTGQLNEAVQKVLVASRLYPEELLFRLEEGKILLELGEASQALEAFRVCAPILRGESDLLSLASALHHAGYSNQCLDLLSPWIKSTQNGLLFVLCGDALFDQKRFQEAIEMYMCAIELGLKKHHLFTQLGHAYRRLGNLAEAEKIFHKLLEKDSRDVTATLGLGLCLQERGHFQKALLIYQSGLAWEMKDQRIFFQSGLCALRSKKYAFAEKCFLEVIQIQESDPQLLAYYGLSLESQKKWQEAEQTYLQMIQLFPSYPQGYRALGWLFGVGLSQILSHEQGLNFAHRAVKLKSDLLSWEILSACYARVGNFDAAYHIQISLAEQDKDPSSQARRQQALRKLRQKSPLDDHHVLRGLVA